MIFLFSIAGGVCKCGTLFNAACTRWNTPRGSFGCSTLFSTPAGWLHVHTKGHKNIRGKDLDQCNKLFNIVSPGIVGAEICTFTIVV